ncbi:MAG: S8 family serine peptidase [Lachnospiraceae bacterium]|nr:S8 family serine peptidase [Lachnospiraceae bacterium]
MKFRWKTPLALFMALLMVFGTMASHMTFVAAEDSDTQAAESSGITWEKIDAEDTDVDLIQDSSAVDDSSISETYADTDTVRAIVILDDEPAAAAVADDETVAESAAVEEQQQVLQETQDELVETISAEVLDGEEVEVAWNLTLLANAVSLYVPYGALSAIEDLDGVKEVYLDTKYETLDTDSTENIIAQGTTGVTTVKTDLGYTGSGTRIAVIDTGTDTDHQSFSGAAYEYALYIEAAMNGMDYEEYVESLDLLDVEEIESVLTQLNAYSRYEGLTAEDLYESAKLPFNYNYIDNTLDVTHDNDSQGEHGSHVAGIATANEYIAGDEEDVLALDFDGDGDLDADDAQYVMEVVTGERTVSDETASDGTADDVAAAEDTSADETTADATATGTDAADSGDAGYIAASLDNADLDGDGELTSYDVYLLLLMIGYYEETGEIYVSAYDAVSVTGVASNAQLITMKVFGVDGGAYASDYMAAIEDAILLGCDTINLSLGSDSGFTESAYELEDEDVVAILTGLEYTDVVVNAAAGNSGPWAMYDEAYGLTYADESGTATVAGPSTYDNMLSVGSTENVGLIGNTFEAAGVSVVYTESTGYGNTEFTSLDTNGDGTEYEYVMLPEGLTGAEEDFEGVDVEGKIVFIQRGTLSFSTKANNAMALGAVAVIVYNNVDGSIGMDLSDYEYTAPVVSITLEEGQEIMAGSTLEENGTYTGTLTAYAEPTVDWGEEDAVIELSYYSAWGTTGALTIKPEIVAPGGNIYSVNGADTSGTGYELMSGTSMATPHVTGITALLAEYIEEEDLLVAAREASDNAALTKRALIQSIMMSTAEPLIEEETGLEYSVRGQGSGQVSAEAAVNAGSFVLVGDDTDGKVKAELGDDPEGEGWSFTFTINNMSDEDLTYALSDSILTAAAEYAEDGTALAADQEAALAAEVTYVVDGIQTDSVTVAALSSATVTVTIYVPEDVAAAQIAAGFVNGFYVEGYIYVTSDGDVEHSIPLLGWYGDWTASSMYDDVDYMDVLYSTPLSYAEDEEAAEAAAEKYLAKLNASHMYNPLYSYGFDYTSDYTVFTNNYANTLLISYAGDSSYYYYYNGNIYGNYLVGTYEDTLEIYYAWRLGDMDYLEYRNAINSTSSAQYSLYSITPSLIRNAARMRMYITDAATGEVYYYTDCDDGINAGTYYSSLECWLNTADDVYGEIDWDYTDADGNALAEGTSIKVTLLAATEYTLEQDAKKDLPEGEEIDWDALWGTGAEYSYTFTIDNTAPEATSMSYDSESDTISIEVTDNRYVAAVILCDGGATEAVDYYYPDMTGEEGQSATITMDLSEFRDTYGNKAVVAVCDYAGNETFYAVNLNGEGNDYGTFVGIQYDGYGSYNWVSFDEDVNMNETVIFAGDIEIVCQEYVGGYIFAEDGDGGLYGMLYEDLLANDFTIESSRLAYLENIYQDFAYDYSTGTLYAILETDDGTAVYTVDLLNYTETEVAAFEGIFALTLACDDDGTLYILYLIDESDNAFLAIMETTEEDEDATGSEVTYERTDASTTSDHVLHTLGDTGVTMDYLQSMTWNHNDETLYWARFDALTVFATISEVYKFSFTEDEDGNITGFDLEATGTLSGEVSGLIAPLTSDAANAEEHQNLTVFDAETVAEPELDAHDIKMNVGFDYQLTWNMVPFYSNYQDVTFTSSDESVATVSADGLVTAVSTGTCVITIASVEDPTVTDTCTVTVLSLDVEIEGTLSVMGSGITNVGDSVIYNFALKDGTSTITTKDIVWTSTIYDGTAANYGTNIGAAVLVDGYIWATEWNNTGLIWKIDQETGEIMDSKYYEPIDGDVMFGMAYSDSTGMFTMEMNYNLYVDLTMDSDMYSAMFDTLEYVYLDDSVYGMYQYTYHRLNLYSYLHSVGNWNTEEDGYSKINIAGITTIEGEGAQDLTEDYQGNAATGASYTPDTTIVLLDNVGRFWYIDEVMNMTLDENGNYVNEAGDCIASDFNGVLNVEYEDEDGNITYSVFVIRTVVESPLTDMFRNDELGITYHFSCLYSTVSEETGEVVYLMSLYDYWNDGTTNELYLYVPGETEEEEIFLSLGDTGEYNVIATIYDASVTGLIGTESDADDVTAAAGIAQTENFVGYYQDGESE